MGRLALCAGCDEQAAPILAILSTPGVQIAETGAAIHGVRGPSKLRVSGGHASSVGRSNRRSRLNRELKVDEREPLILGNLNREVQDVVVDPRGFDPLTF